MDQGGPKHVELTYVMNKTQSLENFVYLVGLHIYYKMIHGPYNINVYHCFLTEKSLVWYSKYLIKYKERLISYSAWWDQFHSSTSEQYLQ